MGYYRGKYRGARIDWLDLAESVAKERGLEFKRDTEQEAFHIPGNRVGVVRASLDQVGTVKTTIREEMKALNGEFGDLEDRIVTILLLINDPNRFDPEVDDFIPIRDSLLTNEKYISHRSSGDIQLTVPTDKIPFESRKNGWEWAFEK